MKSLVVLLATVAAANTLSYFDVVAEEWNAFKLQYKKSYETEAEERKRMVTFARNKYYVAQHNELFERGEVTFRVGLNQFSDMTHSEFVRTMNGLNSTDNSSERVKQRGATFIPPNNVELPENMDWRTAGAVTSVKNQGHQCGSDWAFSSTGALEGQHFRKTGELVSLSEQNLIDCSTEYGNNGCNGGYMDNAFVYIRDNNGIDTEKSYPYEAKENKCRYNPKKSGANDVGFTKIQKGDETKLTKAVATVGPVSVAVDGSLKTFKYYSSGVYYDKKCSSSNFNHAMLVVGYGTDSTGGDYWLLKNSWGTSWGEKGYMKLARNRNNHCGIASEASYPLV